jgi:hypothetical protein
MVALCPQLNEDLCPVSGAAAADESYSTWSEMVLTE